MPEVENGLWEIWGQSGQSPGPFIHLIHPGEFEEIVCPPEPCCGGRGPTEPRCCWKVVVLSGGNETQHILLSLSRDNTVFLKMSLFFLRKLAVFNKEPLIGAFADSLVPIYLSSLFSAKVQPGVVGS